MQLSEIRSQFPFQNLELLARQVVEGFITGMHKSPFHGFSVEFAEHRLYNKGESTRHIDWKLFARTEKLFVKRYQEETNLRCQIVIDHSASMQYPETTNFNLKTLNKIQFSVVAAASLMEILSRQRDAYGLSIYSDKIDYHTPARGSERHKRMLLSQLERTLLPKDKLQTDTHKVLHLIAEKIHRRSLVFLFTDMFQSDKKQAELFSALRHLKYNKHDVVLFHIFDGKLEYDFDFESKPVRFTDIETGENIRLFTDTVRENYQAGIKKYFNDLKMKCMQYKIEYVPVDIHKGPETVLTAFLMRRKQFL